MEKIEVRYTYLGEVAGSSYYHKYIVYTDSNGKQWGARGGPSESPAGGAEASTKAERDGSIPGADSGSPYGDINTEHGEYVPGTESEPGFSDYDHEGDDPSEVIAEGDDLSKEWGDIKDAITQVQAEGHPYRPLSSNSNSTVDEALSTQQKVRL